MSVTTPQVAIAKKTVLNPVSLNFPPNTGSSYTYCNVFKIKGVVAINSIILKNDTFTSNPIPSGVSWSDVVTMSSPSNVFGMRPVLKTAGSVLPLSSAGLTNMLPYFKKNSGSSGLSPSGSNYLNTISEGHYISVTPTTISNPTAFSYIPTPIPLSVGALNTAVITPFSPMQDYYKISLSGVSGVFSVVDVVDNGFGVSGDVITYSFLGFGNGYLLVRTPTGSGFTVSDIITVNSSQYIGVSPSVSSGVITDITPFTGMSQGQLIDGTTSIIGGTILEADAINDTYWSLEFIYNQTGTLATWNPWIGTYIPTIYWTPISADAEILQP